jgi:hypothetical protein
MARRLIRELLAGQGHLRRSAPEVAEGGFRPDVEGLRACAVKSFI